MAYYGLVFCLFSWPNMVKWHNSGIIKPYNKHLIRLFFSVRTVNYGSSFFPSIYGPPASRLGHKWMEKSSVGNLQYGPKTRLIRGIYISVRLNIYICYSPARRSVLGETVPEVLSTARGHRPRVVLRPRAQFLPIRTELGRWITFSFFSYWDLKVSGKFYFSLQPMCVEEGRVRVDVIQSARSIANQNKTLQHDF